MKKILILGATSAIAEACARRFAVAGDHLFLIGRNEKQMHAIADDLRVRGAAAVSCETHDLTDFSRHEKMLASAHQTLGTLDVVLIAHGTLSDQAACQQSPEMLLREFTTNATSVMALSTRIAQILETQRHGTLAVISSVAGERGRASNYVYGAAKAAVTTFLSGLRQRLQPHGVHVLTVKPGFVDTPMTAAFRKGLLWVTPERVAIDIVRAIERRTPVLYTPGFWRWIMCAVRGIPETLFSRLGKTPLG